MRTYKFTELKVGDIFIVDPMTVAGRQRDILLDVMLEKVTAYEARVCADHRSLTGLVGCESIRFVQALTS